MKIALLLILMMLLLTSFGSATEPTLKATPNPAVVPAGQTQGTTTLTWSDAVGDGVIWVAVNGEAETKLSEAKVEGSLEVTVDLGKTYVYSLYAGSREKLLASVAVTVAAQNVEPARDEPPAIPPPGKDVYPAYIYAISKDGTLKWFRHDGAAEGKFDWQGARDVGTGWNKYRFVFPGGGNVIYAITQDGILQWYRHKGFETGLGPDVAGSWEGPNDVGRGWVNLRQVFSGADGIIYAINNDGKLLWFRHNAILSGGGLEISGSWDGPKEVGRGWGNVAEVFSMGGGVIYAVTQTGKLLWYKHNGYLTGRGLESAGTWSDRVELGMWSNTCKQSFAAGGGLIYCVAPDGDLYWLVHSSYQDGVNKSPFPPGVFTGKLGANPNWRGGIKVGSGWAELTNVFALLPNVDTSGVRPVDHRSQGTPRVRQASKPNPDR